jgi:hypothetical protein
VFTAYLLSRNVRIEEDLVDQLFNSSEKRLARILLLLAQVGKQAKPEAVIPAVSQETLAAMVGTTRSRVNYFMNRFSELPRRERQSCARETRTSAAPRLSARRCRQGHSVNGPAAIQIECREAALGKGVAGQVRLVQEQHARDSLPGRGRRARPGRPPGAARALPRCA